MQTQSVLPETLQSSKRQHDQRDATMAADDDGTTPSYGDHSSSYWAPGWNYQRYSNATTEDILGLAPGELLKMQAGLRDVLGEQGVVAMARHNFARSLPTAEEAMATPNVEAGRRCSDGALMSDAFEGHAQGSEAVQGAPEEAVCVDIPPNWLRLWVKRHEGEPWGFVAIRAACYGGEGEEEEEEARWARFKEAFGKMVEVPFDWAAKRTSSGEAVARGRAAFEVRWVEDPALQGAEMDVLRRKYQELFPSLPGGLKHPIFLCATPEVVESVLSAAASSDPPTADSRRWRRGAPYVHAVAASRDCGVEDEHEESAWFRDVFRVAVEVVADELWWLVGSGAMPVRRITRGVKGVGVPADVGNADLADLWWSTAPSPEMVRRRGSVAS
ncbi:hypothetical protein RB597_010243 [Gaeumannomyces tritici]